MMANYNHARFLTQSLEAILTQSYRPLEVVVIDDCSTDNSPEVLERFRRRYPDLLRIVYNERNIGVLGNAPRLMSMARGEYVYFAAADDMVLPQFFERSMRCLEQQRSAALCSTLSYIMNEDGVIQGTLKMPVVLGKDGYLDPADVLSALRAHGNWFQGNTTILRRSALAEAGGLRSELGPYCDGFAYLAMSLKSGACFVPAPLTVWRRMDSTFSARANADIDAALTVLGNAERIMRTELNGLFPTDYIDLWKREMYFGAASAHAVSGPEGFANARRLVPATTRTDAAFDALVRLSPTFGRRLAKVYFFAKLKRGSTWQAIKRRFAHLAIKARSSSVTATPPSAGLSRR